MPRAPSRTAPKRGPTRPAPKAAPRRAPTSTRTPPPAAAPAPPSFHQLAPPGVFRTRLPVRKAYVSKHLRITELEAELYERARTCPQLADDVAEPLDLSEAIRRLAMLGAIAAGLVSPCASPA